MIAEAAVTLPRNANGSIIQNAAVSARSRRKINNIPRIYRWMEDTEEHIALAPSLRLRTLSINSRSRSRSPLRNVFDYGSDATAANTWDKLNDQYLHDGFSQASTLIMRQPTTYERPLSPSSSDSGSSYSCPDVDFDNAPRSARHRNRPNLTIAVKPSPYAARYAVHHTWSPEAPSHPRQPVSPYAPATMRNGFPFYEPRAPAAAYMPTSPRSYASSSADDDYLTNRNEHPPRILQRQKRTSAARPPTRGKLAASPSFVSPAKHHHQHTNSAPAVPFTPVYARPSIVNISRKSSSSIPQLQLDLDTTLLMPEMPRVPDDMYVWSAGPAHTHHRARSMGATPHFSMPRVCP